MADNYRKSITFQAKIDTSEIGPTIENLKRQFNQATAGSTGNMQAQTAARLSQQGMGGIMSVPKPEDIAKSKRSLDQFIREQAQQQEKLHRILEKQKDKLDSLNNIKKESLKSAADELKLEERKKAVLEQTIRLEEQYKARNAAINEALDRNGAKKAGGRSGNEPMDMLKSFSSGGVSGLLRTSLYGAAAVALLEIFKKVVNHVSAQSREITVATGSATQGLVGSQLQSLQGGDVLKTIAFKKEWGESLQEAQSEQQGMFKQVVERLTTEKGLASLIPKLGAKFNIPPELLEKMWGTRFEAAFQSEQMQKQIEKAQQVYAAKMEQDPRKMAAVNMYQQNYMRDLQAQRMMGMSDTSYFGSGGFQERANRAGFNPELAIGMAGQIQQSGGSTRGMSQLATIGLQAQRSFDLTNAGSVLGRISGTAGGDKASEQIFRKLMEESIKAGLDKSDFAEEQRRFADVASEALSQSGVKTAEDAAAVLSGLSKFLPGGDPTIKGIEGAKGAYQQYQDATTQSGGRMGALQMADFMKDPQLRQLGAAGMGEFSEMPREAMVASNEDIMSAASRLGMSPDALAKKLRDLKDDAVLRTLNIDPDDIKDFQNSDGGKAYLKSGGRDLSGLDKKSLNTIQTLRERSRFMFDYKNPQQMNALNMGLLGGNSGGEIPGFGGQAGSDAYGQYLSGLAGGGEGMRRGDTAVAASGEVAQQFLENFREFSKEITPSTQAVQEWTKQLMLSATVLRYTAEGNQAAAQKALAEMMSKEAGKGNAPTVGTPGGGDN